MMDLSADRAVDPTLAGHVPQAPKHEQEAFINRVESSIENKSSIPLLIALAVVAIVIVELLVSWIFLVTQNSAQKTQEARIEAVNKELTGPLASINQEITRINDGLKAYQNMKSSTIDYAPLWTDLKARVVNNTRISSLTADNAGTLKIDGEAKNFTDIATLVASLQKSSTIKNVAIVSTGSNETVKTFTLTAKYVTANQAGVKE